MLEDNSFSRLGYFIVIGLLVISAVYMSYKIGAHEGDMRALRIDRSFILGERDALKEREKQYIEAFQYYQTLLSSGFTLSQDGTLTLKKGTFIIPPAQQGNGT